MSRVPSLEQIFDRHLRLLSTTLRPGTLNRYRYVARHFLAYLRATFPHLGQLSPLRRDPHLLGWLRGLCGHHPPLCNATRTNYLLCLRRLLQDLAKNSPTVPLDLIRSEDFPPPAHYLPRPLSPPEDQRLQQELRRIDDLAANALLLTRATGMRIGECLDLPLDCLQQVGLDQWALHVPLGKLYTERLVPADAEVRRIVARILTLRTSALPAPLPPRETLLRRRGPPPEPLPAPLPPSEALLLPRCGRRRPWFWPMRSTLAKAAQRAGCSGRVVPHRLRHSFATEMLRLGVSLPALMQLLGHKDIRMTLRYVQVTQQDLQREFHQARQRAAQPPPIPELSLPRHITHADLPGIRQALAATRHLLEMYRRQLGDTQAQRKLQRLDRRLLAVASQLERIA
jgi:site-specific recombinase XerD